MGTRVALKFLIVQMLRVTSDDLRGRARDAMDPGWGMQCRRPGTQGQAHRGARWLTWGWREGSVGIRVRVTVRIRRV